MLEFLLGLIHQVYDFLRSPAQALALRRQLHVAVGADQQLDAQFLLHFPNLTG